MIQRPIMRCDCCGLPVSAQAGDTCSRCGYPVNPEKEEQFLQNALRDLQRVATHGGAFVTVTQLISRYQIRLKYLAQQRRLSIAPPTHVQPPIVKPAIQSAIPRTQAAEVVSFPPVKQPVPVTPSVQESPRPPRQVFSLSSFFADQVITIIGLPGAFLILMGALSSIFTINNPLLSFFIVFGVHAFFGIAGAIAYRFPSSRLIARIYTTIYVLLVPLVGFTAYSLLTGNYIHISDSMLVFLAATYAAIVYALLAVYQRFALFGYLGTVALVVADLALARQFHLAYWWWPSMLMILALPALFSISLPSRRQLFSGPLMVLGNPIRVLMYILVGVCAFTLLVDSLYSFQLDATGSASTDVRFAIVSIAVLLLAWTNLYLWRTRLTQWFYGVAWLFLLCVLTICYAFYSSNTVYMLALTGVALLYHGLNRFAPRLLQPYGKPGLHLDILALMLVSIVPFIGSLLLPLQLFINAYHVSLGGYSSVYGNSPLFISANWHMVAELLAVGLGLLLTISVALYRAGLQKASNSQQSQWSWLFLLSGFLLTWEYIIVVLALNVEPVWYFIGLTLALVIIAVLVRQRFGATWANPIDVVVLCETVLTILLSLGHSADMISTLLLSSAAIFYGILLYQRRNVLLIIPFLFGLVALPALLQHPEELLILGIVLPLAAIAIRRIMPERLLSPSIGAAAIPQRPVGWEWPLLVLALLYGLVVSLLGQFLYNGTLSLAGIACPIALAIAALALTWYGSAALARFKWWLIPAAGFAAGAIFIPTNPFAVIVCITVVAIILAAGITRLSDRTWAIPLYIVALVGIFMTGYTGYYQHEWAATTWALLAFAVIAYIVGIIEQWDVPLWIAPVIAIWSVFDAATLPGDLYRPPIIALICAALGVTIGLLHRTSFFLLPYVPRNKSIKYVLPFYVTALAAAILTGIYGTLAGVNYPFYGAIVDALLIYALVAYGVLRFERQPLLVPVMAGFAIWAVVLAIQTNLYYVVAIGLSAGVVGLLTHFITREPVVDEALATSVRPLDMRWSWPWYITALVAAVVAGSWTTVSPIVPASGMIVYSLLAFTLLALIVMLVERVPEMLVLSAGLAVWTIWQWQYSQPLASIMIAYSLLCVLMFVLQFVWKRIKRITPVTQWGSPSALHSMLSLAGQTLIILIIIAHGGLLADAGLLAYVGAASLVILAVLVFGYGRVQQQISVQQWCNYIAGFLVALVISWILSIFHQTNLDILTLAPATYLIMIAPIMLRNTDLPMRHRLGQFVALLGTACLLLPTLWLSFSNGDTNLLYTLLLMGEAFVLLLLGIGMRIRVFVLSGAGLIVIGALHALFLPTAGIPTPLALTLLGVILLMLATSLSFVRRRLKAAWREWE